MQRIKEFFRKFNSSSSTFNYIFLVELIFLCVYAYVFDYKIFMGGDNAEYYMNGLAIAGGHGYTNIDMVGNPPANHFSPGYSYIISIIIRIFGDSMLATQIANGFFLLGVIFILFYIVKDITKSNNLAFVVSLVTLLNAYLLFYSYITMSEIPFTFFAILSVWLFMKTFSKGGSLRQPYFWLLVIAVIVAFYIKSIGIAIVGASLVIFLANKRWLQAVILVTIFLTAYMPWHLRTEKLGGSVYAKQIQMVNPYDPTLGKITFSDYPRRFVENVDRYISTEIPSAIFGNNITNVAPEADWLDYLLGMSLVFFAIVGIYSLPEFRWFLLMSIGGIFFILMLWPPIWNGVRFMIPLIPFLLFLIIQGILTVVKKRIKVFASSKKFLRYAPYAFLLIIPKSIAQIKILHVNSESEYLTNYNNYVKLGTWCKDNLPADAVIACRKPGLFYLFARHKVTTYAYTLDDKKLIDDLKAHGVTHVVLDDLGFSSTALYLYPAMSNNQDKFEDIKSFGGDFLTKIHY